MPKYSSAERQLRHLKGFRVKTGMGLPKPSEGSDGELTLRMTKSGLKLLCKFKNKWYGVGDQSLQEAAGADLDTPNSISQSGTTINSRTGALLMGGVIAMGGQRTRGGLQYWDGRVSASLSPPINSDGNTTSGLRFHTENNSVIIQDVDTFLTATKKLYFDGLGGHTYIHESSADVLDMYVGGDKIFEANEAALGNNFDFWDNVDVRLKATTNSATAASTLQFDTQRGTSTTTRYGQDGDLIGKIVFQGRNDGASNVIDGSPVAQPVVYGQIESTIIDASDGTDTGLLEIDSSGDITLDAGGDITLDAAGSDINFNVAGTGPRLNWNSGQGLRIYSPNDLNDMFNILVGIDHGATTISTNDASGSQGHLTIAPDGDLYIGSATGKFKAKMGNTEFSAPDSAYAGMILAYTHLTTTGGNEEFSVGTTHVVIDSNGKVSFVAPPSGNVEIEFSIFRDSSSSNKTVQFSLSTAAIYNLASAETGDGSTTYDLVTSYGFDTADETDDRYLTGKFVVGGLTSGTAYTYWLAAGGSSTTYLKWGGLTSTNPDRYFPPFVIKATALPTLITP